MSQNQNKHGDTRSLNSRVLGLWTDITFHICKRWLEGLPEEEESEPTLLSEPEQEEGLVIYFEDKVKEAKSLTAMVRKIRKYTLTFATRRLYS